MDTKIKALILLLFSAFTTFAQTPGINFAAKFNITSATGGDPYNITGIVLDDLSRFTGSDVQVNDSIYVIDGDQLYVLAVTSITSVVGPTVTLVANDPNNAGVSIPTGQAAICRPTDNYKLPLYISGLRDDLRSMVMNRQAQLIDDINGSAVSAITDFTSAGVNVPPSPAASLNGGETWRNMTTGELWGSDGNVWYPYTRGPKECLDTVLVSAVTIQSGGSLTTGSPLIKNASGVWQHMYNHPSGTNLIPDGVVTDIIVGGKAIIQYCGVRKGSGATPNTSYYVDQTISTGFTTTKPTTNIRPLGKVASNGDFIINAGLLFSRDNLLNSRDSTWAKTDNTYFNKRITDDIYRQGTVHLGSNNILLPSGDGAVNSQVDLKILHSRQGSSGSAPAIFVRNVSAPSSPALSNAFLPLMWQLDSASCPSALPFMIYQSYFPGASSAGDNTTGGIGFNLGRGGASYVPGKPGAVIQFEQNFAANTSTGDMELWAGFNTTAPGSFRPWYFTASKTDGANSVGAISGNTLYFTNGGTQQSQTKGFWTSNYFQMQNPVTNNNFALELSTLGTGQTSLRMRNPNNNYVSDVLKFANGANYLEFSGDADVKFANKIFSFDCNNEGKAIISASFNTPNPRDTINFGWWSGIPGAGVFDDAPLMRLITRDNGGFLIGRHGQLLDKYTQLGIWSNNFYISTTGAAPANTTTPAFSIQDATGNVGINVDPSTLLSTNKLTVAGNVYLPPNGSAARTINWGTGGGTSAILYDGGAGSRFGYGIASGEMQFFIPTGTHFSFNKGGDIQTAGTNEIMRINEDGKVGIKTTTPDEALHVVGNIKTSSLAGTGTRIVTATSAGVLTSGVAVSSLMREESFTATGGQTAFTIAYSAPAVSGTSVPIRVYRNGVRLFYVASGPTITQFTYSGTTVTTAANTTGDIITIEYLN